MKRIQGFTLAEVLITLAIIGVVAAMTIPILMQNYQKGQYLTALKKVYSQISDAIDRTMMDSNADNFNDVSLIKGSSADPKAFFKKYFRVSKYCDNANYDSCFPKEFTHIDKSAGISTAGKSTDYCVNLKDGSSICVGNTKYTSALYFLVDTNGLEKPNISGRDIFTFNVFHDGSVDEVDPERRDSSNTKREDVKAQCETDKYGSGCFSKIFDAGWKMDY